MKKLQLALLSWLLASLTRSFHDLLRQFGNIISNISSANFAQILYSSSFSAAYTPTELCRKQLSINFIVSSSVITMFSRDISQGKHPWEIKNSTPSTMGQKVLTISSKVRGSRQLLTRLDRLEVQNSVSNPTLRPLVVEWLSCSLLPSVSDTISYPLQASIGESAATNIL